MQSNLQYCLSLRFLIQLYLHDYAVCRFLYNNVLGYAIQSSVLSVLKVSDSIVPDYVLYLFLYKNILRYAIELSVSFVSKKVLTKFCLSAL